MAEQDKEQMTVFPQEAAQEALPPQDDDPNAPLHRERGLEPPYAGDGTNTGLTRPQWGPQPGVTPIDRGGDPAVPAFIPDATGPRVVGEEEAAATVEERAQEAAEPASAAAHQQRRAARASKAKDEAADEDKG